jgi:hypothetical protein
MVVYAGSYTSTHLPGLEGTQYNIVPNNNPVADSRVKCPSNRSSWSLPDGYYTPNLHRESPSPVLYRERFSLKESFRETRYSLMTEQRQRILDSNQIQNALQVVRAYLTAPKNPDGRTPMEVQTERDQQRVRLIESELKPLLKDYLSGQLNLTEFKTKVDGINKRNEFWGFKGVKGQMFFNMVVNVADDSTKCDQEIKAAIKVPTNEDIASGQIKTFCNYVNRIASTIWSRAAQRQADPSQVAFRFSCLTFGRFRNEMSGRFSIRIV